VLVSSFSVAAHAQEATAGGTTAEPASDGAPIMAPVEETSAAQPVAAQPAMTTPAATTPAANGGEPVLEGDHPRFRFGVSAGAGPIVWDGPTLTYGGADVRVGVQINQLIGVYVQPQLGFYSGNFNGATGIGGIVGASAGADFTFFDRFFVGAGAGYAVLNNPHGFEAHFRIGAYPIVSGGDTRARRKGLMIGVDMRLHFLDGATFFAPTFAIGYEAF